MFRIVLDTNVIISALIAKKLAPPLSILSYIKNKLVIHVTSPEILEEAEEVMNRDKIVKKHHLSQSQVRDLVLNFAQVSYVIPVKTALSVVKSDPDDDKFIAAALDGMADYIVSGDKHLLDIKEYHGIKIVTPGEFIEELQKAE